MAERTVVSEDGDSDNPGASTIRKLTLLVRLMRYGRVQAEAFRAEFGVSERSLKRDLRHVRVLAEEAGFAISPIRAGAVTMTQRNGALSLQVDRGRRDAEQMLAALAKALGEPVGRRLPRDGGAQPPPTARFLHFAFPELIGDRWVADVYEALERIWQQGAFARFRYPKAGHPKGTERLVEPYAVIARSGRYFLIAYDRDAKGWRYFALDQILTSKPQAAGRMASRRALPPYIRPGDVIGVIIGDAKTEHVEVTVELSRRIAASVASRRWQHDQVVTLRDGGSATITLKVSDVTEVVRWACGFGDDARIVAPEQAVSAAREMLTAMGLRYAPGDAAP
ncbi:MAG TPA: WYL domain-containing protein [Candidatus Dormibacteraeota bacterium]|nr:WYL domain-containing protein [Candidatus Dormibacteraeota bacterium]